MYSEINKKWSNVNAILNITFNANGTAIIYGLRDNQLASFRINFDERCTYFKQCEEKLKQYNASGKLSLTGSFLVIFENSYESVIIEALTKTDTLIDFTEKPEVLYFGATSSESSNPEKLISVECMLYYPESQTVFRVYSSPYNRLTGKFDVVHIEKCSAISARFQIFATE